VTRELVARLVRVMFGVKLARLICMVLRVKMVSVGDMGVVSSLLVITRGMRRGGCVMVLGGVFVVSGCLPVMLDLFLVRHDL
jgi:hypothetical protein